MSEDKSTIDELVEQIIKEMPMRATEDIDEWADKLANDVCGLTD